jgi:HSP20 family protein
MSLVRYDWSLMNRLHRELEQALGQSGPVALIPRVDVREESGRYLLRADLPGVAPQDIEITTDQGILTLRAQRRSGAEGADTVTYQRRFALPEEADAEQITARCAHGVLEIAIGKIVKAQPRRISVEAA